jgi:hypothetical protein
MHALVHIIPLLFCRLIKIQSLLISCYIIIAPGIISLVLACAFASASRVKSAPAFYAVKTEKELQHQ